MSLTDISVAFLFLLNVFHDSNSNNIMLRELMQYFPYSCKQSHAWVFALDHHVCIICLESTPLTSWKETECNPKKYVFFLQNRDNTCNYSHRVNSEEHGIQSFVCAWILNISDTFYHCICLINQFICFKINEVWTQFCIWSMYCLQYFPSCNDLIIAEISG